MKLYCNYIFIRIKNSYLYLSLLDNYFLLVIGITLLFLCFNNIIYLVFLILFCVYLGKRTKWVFLSLIVLIIIILCHYQRAVNSVEFTDNEITGIVKEVKKKESSNQITIENANYKVIVYDSNKLPLKAGMRVYVTGDKVTIDNNRIENGFNYRKYLQYHYYDGVISSNNIVVLGRSFCLEVIKEKVFSYFETNFSGDSLIFMKALVLGDDDNFTAEFDESLKINGIIHLFAISGSHITLFVVLLTFLFDKLKIKKRTQNMIIVSFLMFYLIVTSFSPSILRAALMYIVALISSKLKLRFTSLDIASLVYIGLLIFNPFYIYDIGFVLSFIVSFLIILVIPLLKKGELKQCFIISLLAQVVTFPLIININYEINLLAPLTNIIYIFVVESVILPLSLILVFLPWLQTIYNYLIIAFKSSSFLFSKYFSINMRFPFLNDYIIIIYYLLLLSIIYFYHHRKLKILLSVIICFFLIGLNNISIFNTSGEINFLDLYNGEAIVITDRCGKCNAVIDTGDGKNNEVTTYLKSKGIEKLDYLILTHNHIDHNGEAKTIINEFKVNKIIVSAYDNNEIGNLSNVIRVKRNDVVKCGDINLHILHPDKYYLNENDNSIVIYSHIGHHRFLFIGDISSNIEMKFAYLDIDVIKIGHHGSKTSSSKQFLAALNPKLAIIQSGRVKKFGFPHQEVIDTLSYLQIDVYRTDVNYSIKYKYSKKKSIFKTLK